MKTNFTRNFIFLVIATAFIVSDLPAQKKGQVKANGISIAYESFGSKKSETILLIAGTNAQLTMWPIEFCEGLVKHGYRVIRFDNRDIGLSTKFDSSGMPDWAAIGKALDEKRTPPLPYTLDDMADDATGLLQALKIKKAHIVGASMGGMIAQRVAYNHPENVLSLTSIMAGSGDTSFPLVAKPEVINTIPQPGDPGDTADYIKREQQSMKVLAGGINPPDSARLETYVKQNVKRSYYPEGFYRQGAVAMSGFYTPRSDKLKTITIPTLVIHGTEDPLVSIDAGKNVAQHIPGAKFETIEGMGHDLPVAVLDRLVELIAGNAAQAKK